MITAIAIGGVPAMAMVAEVREGKAELTGRPIFPDMPGYDEARQLWDRIFVSYPLVIVYCQNADDVRNAVAWSRQNGVKIRARSGGHSLEGWSSIDGGVVVDVSGLKRVVVDIETRTATIGTGLNQGE